MPCRDGGPSPSDEARHILETRLSEHEAMLCGILRAIEARDGTIDTVFDAVDWHEAGVSRRDTATWWKHHKAIDDHRRAQERAREEERLRQERLVEAALGKLSAEEFAALQRRIKQG